MSEEIYLGTINGHVVGRLLKEAVRRAMHAIRSERMVFEATVKQGHDGEMDDVFTSADTKAQAIYLRTFVECFPSCGVVGEEGNLTIASALPCEAYFTVDPLDGTRAFVREQSHGYGSMVAFVDKVGGKVISAYVGDVSADEVYGYRPGSDRVWRITRLDTFKELGYKSPFVKGESYVLLRDSPESYSAAAQACIKDSFKKYLVDGGSIGTWMARLWKREIAAVIIPPGHETPWDSTPVMGISKKLGYRFFRPATDGGWEPTEFSPRQRTVYRDHDLLVVHQEDVQALIGT